MAESNIQTKSQNETEKPNEPQIVADVFRRGLLWLVSSIGLTGILVGFGFLADISTSDRLGFAIADDPTPSRFVIAFGQFAVAILQSVLTLLNVPRWAIIVACVLAVGIAIASYFWFQLPGVDDGTQGNSPAILLKENPRTVRARRNARTVGVIQTTAIFLSIFATSWTFIRIEVPSLYVKDMLHSTLKSYDVISDSTVIGAAAQAAVLDQICARLNVPPEDSTAANPQTWYPSCPGKTAGSLQFTVRAQHRIEQRFALTCLSCVLGILVTILAQPRAKSSNDLKEFNIAMLRCLWCTTALSVLMLPILYGRTQSSTEFPVSQLQFTNPEGKTDLMSLHILGQTKDEVATYSMEKDAIVILSRSKILQSTITSRNDVLAAHFAKKINPN